MVAPRVDVQILDTTQSLARVGGLFLIRTGAMPEPVGIRKLVAAVKRESPWALFNVFEIEKLGLPDEPTRAAYGELVRAGDGIFHGTALVAERALLSSIVRSVTSGLRLINRTKTVLQVFSDVIEATHWLDGRRPSGVARLDAAAVQEALAALRAS